MSNIITDIFMYYAKFPQRSGVENLFNKGRSDFPEYATVLTQVKALPDIPVCPEISDYVFGNNEDAIRKRIAEFKGFYLLIDYGDIESERDNMNRIKDSFYIAATVAYPISEFTGDLVEQMIIADKCLSLILSIRNFMMQEQKEHYWLKNIENSHSITPFVARELNGSIGSTLMFSRQGFDMLGAK